MLQSMRLSALRRRLERCLRLLRDERGVALVMALGILMVLSLALGTVIYMTAAGARDAQRTNGGQKAYALAETGLNNILSQVAANYPNATAGSNSWVSSGSASYDGGTASWSGQFATGSCPANTWCLQGTGAVANPTGPTASQITRVVTARITVSPQPGGYPFGVFSGDPNASCTTMTGGITVNVPVYIASCLTLGGNFSGYDAKIWEPPPYSPSTVTVEVGKALTLTGGATIGTSTHNVKAITYGTTCSPSPCNAANGFNGPVSTPTAVRLLPNVNAQAIYDSVPWGSATCTGVNPFDNDATRNNSKGTLDLTTLASYSCSVTDGSGTAHSIAWNSATHALTIQNSWFVDGNLAIGTHNGMKYTGDGTIYFNGTVTNMGTVCGPPSVYTVPDVCSKVWDPTSGNKLLIVACNGASVPSATSWSQSTASAIFEADAWAVGTSSTTSPAYSLTGNGWFGGSVFTTSGYANIAGNGVIHSAVTLPSGGPSNYVLAAHPTNYAGG